MDLGIVEKPTDALVIAAQFESGDFAEAKTAREMMEKIPRARSIILAAAFRALGARKAWYEKGNSEANWEPDFKTQLDAAKFLLSYADGLPVQTSLAVTVGDRPDDDLPLDQALQRSPALRERVAKLLSLPTT